MSPDNEWKFGRRPKRDEFDDLDPMENQFREYSENGTDEDEENEEIDFDKPDFQKGEMWNDYAEDMDFEE